MTLSIAGAGTAITSFALTYAFVYVLLKSKTGDGRLIDFFLPNLPSFVGLIASLKLFKAALSGVLKSPISFFDTTPMGIKKSHYLLPFNDELIKTFHRPNPIEVVERSGHHRSRAADDLNAGKKIVRVFLYVQHTKRILLKVLINV